MRNPIFAALGIVFGLVLFLAGRMSDQCAEDVTQTAQQCVGTGHSFLSVIGIAVMIVAAVIFVRMLMSSPAEPPAPPVDPPTPPNPTNY